MFVSVLELCSRTLGYKKQAADRHGDSSKEETFSELSPKFERLPRPRAERADATQHTHVCTQQSERLALFRRGF